MHMIPLTPCQHCVLVVTTPPAVCAWRCNPSEGLPALHAALLPQADEAAVLRVLSRRGSHAAFGSRRTGCPASTGMLACQCMAACQNMLALVTISFDIHKQMPTKNKARNHAGCQQLLLIVRVSTAMSQCSQRQHHHEDSSSAV